MEGNQRLSHSERGGRQTEKYSTHGAATVVRNFCSLPKPWDSFDRSSRFLRQERDFVLCSIGLFRAGQRVAWLGKVIRESQTSGGGGGCSKLICQTFADSKRPWMLPWIRFMFEIVRFLLRMGLESIETFAESDGCKLLISLFFLSILLWMYEMCKSVI